jgi:hypothetical protein
LCWAFHGCVVGEVWDNKGSLKSGKVWDNKESLKSSAKVIHTIKFYKVVSIREWHISSSLEKYEYLEVLFCYDRSLRSIGSYRIYRIKGMWCLYCS